MDTERNPFDSDEESPFADDSVAMAAQNDSMQELQPIEPLSGGAGGAYGEPDDESPFADSRNEGAHSGKISSAKSSSPKPASPKESELQKREQDLDRREAELRRREAALRSGGTSDEPAYNWPLPPYWRIAYHSIAGEIPTDHRRDCRLFYLVWITNAILLIYNFFLILILYFGSGFGNTGSPTLQVLYSFIYMCLGIVLSWRTWYRDIYYAYRDAKTRKWISFFIFFALHILWNCFMFIGYQGSGAAGIVWMLDEFSNKSGWGVPMLITVLISAIIIASSVYLIKKAHSTYTTGGHSKKAKQEITREVGRAALESQMAQGNDRV